MRSACAQRGHVRSVDVAWLVTEDLSGINTEIADTSGIVFAGSGTEEFHGRMLPYEEYTANFTVTRYFMDGTNLAGIRVISGSEVADIEILEMSQAIPQGLFEIPPDYTELSMDM